MAEKKKKRKNAKPKASKKLWFITILLMIGLTPLLRYGMLLFALGMLPAFVSSYADTSQDRNLFKVMLACNFSGVLPILVRLWRKGITFDNMWMIFSDANAWLIMYGAAAFGWLLMWFFPQLVHFMLELFQRNKISQLQERQQKIVNEWGMQVQTSAQKNLRNEAYEEVRASSRKSKG